ncbi:MAG: hypothetical protein K8F91_21480, partial [Candidatus Obscuribacterales bacterium]|nr:hypothetical protein [Candidatus Obscuribacterales bacterium]
MKINAKQKSHPGYFRPQDLLSLAIISGLSLTIGIPEACSARKVEKAPKAEKTDTKKKNEKKKSGKITNTIQTLNQPAQRSRVTAPSPAHLIKLAVAANPSTSPDLLDKLARDDSDMVRRAVAEHPDCSDQCKDLLANDSDQLVVEALLRNKKGVNAKILLNLVASGQPKICETIAANPATPPVVLDKLARGKTQTEYLLLSLARNPATTTDVIDRLVKVGDRLVRTFLARQAKLTKESYEQLAEDGD